LRSSDGGGYSEVLKQWVMAVAERGMMAVCVTALGGNLKDK
jgi:hypothetical protein